jgi:hypothetical protein
VLFPAANEKKIETIQTSGENINTSKNNFEVFLSPRLRENLNT